MAGKILFHRLRRFVYLTLTGIPIPTHGRTGDQNGWALLTLLQPCQQLLGQGDAATPQQGPAAPRPGTIGDRLTRQVDHRIERLLAILFKAAYAPDLGTAQFGNLRRPSAPYRELMPLP
ncbi:hypothetical protein D3C81_1149670 [compost metagenome]